MKFVLILCLAFFGFAGAILPGRGLDMGPTVLQPGLFSYQAPKGWSVQDSPLSKCKVCVDAPKGGFAANLNVVIEANAKSLPDYVAANVAALKASPVFHDLKVVSQQAFTTAAGLDGTRLEITDTLDKFDLRQVFYFFDGGSGNKVVVTASCLIGDSAADAPLFDASMKTFSLE